MELNDFFKTVEETKEAANWQAAFGEPQVIGDKTIIPVARVAYGFGLGFGSGEGPVTADTPEGEETPTGAEESGGGGGGAMIKPLGALVVTPEAVYFEETMDSAKIAIGAFVMIVLVFYQLTKTLRAIFG